MADKGHNGLTYAQAGVDIDAGNALVERIKPLAKSTQRPGAEASLGGFGALVSSAADLPDALQRAYMSRKPACINVMIESVAAPVIRR